MFVAQIFAPKPEVSATQSRNQLRPPPPLRASVTCQIGAPLLHQKEAAIFAMARLTVSSPATAAAFGFTQIDVPGGIDTQPRGINDAGQIAGSFLLVETGPSFPFHGFLLDGGSFTQIDVPGERNTHAFGINDAGQIVAASIPPNIRGAHSFLYTGGSFTQIDVPGAILTSRSTG
jgi:hypothetical protein